ncbi:hypothetical protein GCM10029978_012510 [Actinoallomurus acanthiterrae]
MAPAWAARTVWVVIADRHPRLADVFPDLVSDIVQALSVEGPDSFVETFKDLPVLRLPPRRATHPPAPAHHPRHQTQMIYLNGIGVNHQG